MSDEPHRFDYGAEAKPADPVGVCALVIGDWELEVEGAAAYRIQPPPTTTSPS
jgi:hypothetical protein